MAESFASLDGHRMTSVRLYVPSRGAWVALCDFEADPDVSGQVTLQIGAMTLSGTVVPEFSGAFGEQRRVMVVAGAGAWGAAVRARSYHNDAGVKASLVAEDVAREIGETLGSFEPSTDRLGADYVRDSRGARAASRVLEDVIGDAAWWVDFNGLTQVGTREPAPALLDADYQILLFNPRERMATLSARDPSQLQIGSVIAGPALPEPQTIRDYTIQVDAAGVRILAWCGGSERSAGRLADLFRTLATRMTDDSLFGLYRYRVVNMAADGRVSLQAVRRGAGLPDIEPISQWPGVPGAYPQLTPGAIVLVSFIEGDRSAPIVTHYEGKGGQGFVPVQLTLGGDVGSPAARQNDTVEVLLPPAVFSGTINGGPASGIITFPLMKTLGSISTGSSKVKIAT